MTKAEKGNTREITKRDNLNKEISDRWARESIEHMNPGQTGSPGRGMSSKTTG